ncbi:hypothetical protein PV04_01470 [Phialophora macrospora]|uniref:Uncharacterized protein n=1 Tax=Phialophora macrospora TaxID=1851006 RepID=A0A0D2G3E6_9EURO|nr:hypothetical protein PV04_01470 [Phialophora macrospora]
MEKNLGGNPNALPPPELALDTFVETAAKAVKAKYSDAVLKDVDAKKVSGGGKRYELSFTARFRVQSSKMVTATGDGKTISQPSAIPLGRGDVKDMSQVTAKIYALVGKDSFIGNIELYTSFTLFRKLATPSTYPPLPDQPYFDFRDKNEGRLALLGASDEKVYTE